MTPDNENDLFLENFELANAVLVEVFSKLSTETNET